MRPIPDSDASGHLHPSCDPKGDSYCFCPPNHHPLLSREECGCEKCTPNRPPLPAVDTTHEWGSWGPRPHNDGLIVDLFAGGGGASIGIEEAFGEHVDIAINHDAEAIAVHKANHPNTKHFQTDIWEVDPLVATEGRPVKFLHASPDCKHFSRAKGDVPKSHGVRSLADVVLLWARLKKPLVITLENVPEFVTWGPLGLDGKPIKALAGEFYEMWRAELVALGYIFDSWVLDSSEYGAPTKRKRYFAVARRDGKPIEKPRATHGNGPGLKPLVPAAKHLDFERKIHSVLPCVCDVRRKGTHCPACGGRLRPLAEKTLKRIAAGIERYVKKNPYVVKTKRGTMVPTLINTRNGERKGQRPRALDVTQPYSTITAQGSQGALAAIFIAKHFGGVVGIPATGPISTITAKDHHSVVAASLVKFRGTSSAHKGAASVAEPLGTISAGGNHSALVETTLTRAAFFIEYYGQGSGITGAPVDAPLPTVTCKPRFALVMVDGEEYAITDIAMRMVDNDELAGCQMGRFAAGYDDSAVKTKAGKTRLIGNSVPPEVEEALVAANLPDTVNGWEFSRRLAA